MTHAIWDRTPNETTQAYGAFVVYRDLGPERTLTLTCERLGKTRSLISRWSSQHDWSARAAAYDAHLDDLQQQARAKTLVLHAAADADVWATRLQTLREREWFISQKLLDVVERGLIDPELSYKLGDLAKVLELSVRLTRYLSIEANTDAADDHTPATIEVEYINP